MDAAGCQPVAVGLHDVHDVGGFPIDRELAWPGQRRPATLTGLADKHGISHQTVAEIWRAFGLKPWREDSFKISRDPDLVEKIRDLVAL